MIRNTIIIIFTGYYEITKFIRKTIINVNNIMLNTLIYFLPATLVSSLLTYFKIEPLIDDWISISTLKKDVLREKYILQENYYFKNTDNYSTCKDLLLLLPFSQSTCLNISGDISNTTTQKEEKKIIRCEMKDANFPERTNELIGSLIIKKGENKFIVNHLLSRSSIRDFSNTEKTNVEILDIVYKNEKMKKNIIIDLPRSILLVGNDILSNVYILRYLKYKNMEKYFDENYQLDILLISPSNDNQIEKLNVKYNQYIKLYKSTYVLREVS